MIKGSGAVAREPFTYRTCVVAGEDLNLRPLGYEQDVCLNMGRPLTFDLAAAPVSLSAFRDRRMSGGDVPFQGQTRVMILLGTRPKY
jgi:hypothetical protein